ncbi:hypothetical protein F5876DRAFT_84924 [Lentinula aff. lateritia]|uniref:Uncharacterized protein n=1 Tax=Lentinula aff. lateritia TaxID=2804960 RepID=A0ACC1TFY2_9AGAR|nr:hypothetical protein F5876DRAFT_84924 [Lentinula aff. lateritia]
MITDDLGLTALLKRMINMNSRYIHTHMQLLHIGGEPGTPQSQSSANGREDLGQPTEEQQDSGSGEDVDMEKTSSTDLNQTPTRSTSRRTARLGVRRPGALAGRRGGLFEINSPDVESLNKLRKHQKEMMLRIDKHAEIQTETLNQLKIMNEGNTKRDSQLQRQEGQLQRQEARMAELQRTQEQILSHLHLASPLASTTRAVPVHTSFEPSRPFAPAAVGVNTQSSIPSGFRPFAPSASGPVPVQGGASGSVPDDSTGPTTATGTPGPGGFRSTGIANPVGSDSAPAGATGVPNANNLPSGNEWGKFPAGYRVTNSPITGPNSLWNVELQVKDRTPVHKSPDQIARQVSALIESDLFHGLSLISLSEIDATMGRHGLGGTSQSPQTNCHDRGA